MASANGLVEEDLIGGYLSEAKAPTTHFTALSIDGGGVRGLIPALLIKRLAKEINIPLYELFDYIGGTSIGGILALSLVTPELDDEGRSKGIPKVNPQDLPGLFRDHGRDIFPTGIKSSYSITQLHHYFWDKLKYLISPVTKYIVAPYKTDGLEEFLKTQLNEKTYLDQVLGNVMVTAVDISEKSYKPFLFDSIEANTHYLAHRRVRLWEVGRSTSAGPCYYPAHQFKYEASGHTEQDNHLLIDGGLWLNNPASLVSKQLFKWARQNNMVAWNKNIHVISLGTGYANTDYPLSANAGYLPAARPLIETLMSVSSQHVDQTMTAFLGDNYIRINPRLDKNIELDEVGEPTYQALEEAAELVYPRIEELVREEGPLRKILEAGVFKDKSSQQQPAKK